MVQEETENRHKVQGQQPCPHCLWIPSLKEHDHHRQYQVNVQKMLHHPSPDGKDLAEYTEHRFDDSFHYFHPFLSW